MYILIKDYVDVCINFKKLIYNLEEYGIGYVCIQYI